MLDMTVSYRRQKADILQAICDKVCLATACYHPTQADFPADANTLANVEGVP